MERKGSNILIKIELTLPRTIPETSNQQTN